MEIGIKRFIFDRINPTYIKFYPYFSRYFWPIIACILLTFAVSSSGAVFPLALKYLIDHVFFQKTITNPLPFLLLLLLLVIGLDVFRFFQAYLITKVELRLELHLRLALVKSLFFKKMSFVRKKHTGEIISLLNNDLRLAQHIPNLLIRIFLEFPIRMAICLGMMLYLDFYLGIFVFLVAPLVYIVLNKIRRYRRRLAEKKMKLRAQILQDFHEFIASIKIIKVWDLVSFCSDKIQSHANFYLNQSLKEVKLNNLVKGLMSIIVVLILCLLIYLGLYRIDQGNTTPGNYAGFFLALWYFSQPVKQIAMGYSTLLDATVAAERILGVLETNDQNEPPHNTGLEISKINKIEIRNASFGYGTRKILVNVNLLFEPGKLYILSGPNGAGKTTVVESLLGFNNPDTGVILINDRPYSHYRLSSIRNRISWVPQDLNLFNLSVRENIIFGKQNLTPQEKNKYAWSLETSKFADSLQRSSRDDSTNVAEKGANFSGGEKQRLCIARAFFKDHDVLILDEANANISQSSFEAILNTIYSNSAQKIIIFITHANRYLKYGDIVFEFLGETIVQKAA